METMSWSDDTRCLYCEGRLPLYRKVTHGQFCSTAHRKAYWQEQERLAIERLQQSHSSLRTYSAQPAPEDGQQAPQQTHLLAAPPGGGLERLIEARVATLTQPATHLDAESVPSTPYRAPNISEPPFAPFEVLSLLGPELAAIAGTSPERVAVDPFEYEITRQPLPPSHASVLKTKPLPQDLPVAVWTNLGQPQTNAHVTQRSSAAEQLFETELRQPASAKPAVAMRAAGRIGLPVAEPAETQRAAAMLGSTFEILEMEPAPQTFLRLEFHPQSDVLLELLDQQVPQPDRMHPLGHFAASQPALTASAAPPNPEESPVHTALPATELCAAAPDYRLPIAKMLPLSGAMPAAQGSVALAEPSLLDATLRTALPGAALSAVAPKYQLSSAKMQRLPHHVPAAQGSVLAQDASPEIALNPQPGISPAVMPRVESIRQMRLAGLQSLGASLLRPVQGAFALLTAAPLALDLSTGVCSDISYPSLSRVVISSEAPPFTRILPLTFAKKRRVDIPRIEPIVRLLPETIETHPIIPNSGLEPLDRKPQQDSMRGKKSGRGSSVRGEGLGKLEPAWAHATGFWHHAPRDLKLLLFAIPALLALVFHPGLPRVASAAPSSSTGFANSFQHTLNTQWANVRQTLENRAAVALDDDFRSGLDNWASPGGSTTEWSFDATGFVRPGPLALYRPSVNLTDYQFQFMGMIDKKALSWVVRASDFENFYVVKLDLVKTGPQSAVSVTRYAVIKGKAQDRHDVKIPLAVEPDTLYRVRMDVHGSDFTLEVQGQIADSWTETRLPKGGIGFFTASGEASRLRWMQITHQYDMLGRLCAYLAPYDTTNGSWQP